LVINIVKYRLAWYSGLQPGCHPADRGAAPSAQPIVSWSQALFLRGLRQLLWLLQCGLAMVASPNRCTS